MKAWPCRNCGAEINISMCQQGGFHVGCYDQWVEKTKATMKIFKLTSCDWFAAETMEQAKECLKETFGPPAEGQTEEEFFDEYLEDPAELTDEEMDRLLFSEEEYEDEDDLDEKGEPKEKGGEKKPFRKKLDEMIAAGEKFPCLFASTEY